MTLRSAIASAGEVLAEALTLGAMEAALPAAARLLPRAWALALADAISAVLVLVPPVGTREYHHIRAAFRTGTLETLRMARRRLALPFRSFVIQKRILNHRENARDWRIVEHNREYVADILESGESYVLASAHFNRHALMALACPGVTPGRFVQVTLPPSEPAASISEWLRRVRCDSLRKTLTDMRVRVQLKTLLDTLARAWDRRVDYAFVRPDDLVAHSLYRRLREKGTVVSLHVDAYWDEHATGSFSRPFAGLQNRTFALGAAQLARLAKCPIVTCSYWLEDCRTIAIEWSRPILGVEDEMDAMNRVVDSIEAAIGRRPTQYALVIASDRYWNSAREQWSNQTASPTNGGPQ